MPRPADGGGEAVKAVLMSATPPGAVWRFSGDGKSETSLRPEPVLRLSSLLMVHDAVRAGAGAAMLPKLLVEDDVAGGRLALWGVQTGPPVEIWALQNSRRLVGAKTRAFLDVMQQAFPQKVYVPPA
jgi:DNA-binding transcriptional LysR family regulator